MGIIFLREQKLHRISEIGFPGIRSGAGISVHDRVDRVDIETCNELSQTGKKNEIKGQLAVMETWEK